MLRSLGREIGDRSSYNADIYIYIYNLSMLYLSLKYEVHVNGQSVSPVQLSSTAMTLYFFFKNNICTYRIHKDISF